MYEAGPGKPRPLPAPRIIQGVSLCGDTLFYPRREPLQGFRSNGLNARPTLASHRRGRRRWWFLASLGRCLTFGTFTGHRRGRCRAFKRGGDLIGSPGR